MTAGAGDFNQLWNEYLALGLHLGDVQQRCSAVISEQLAQIKMLQAQTMRLRADLIVHTTTQHLASDTQIPAKTTNNDLPAPAIQLVSATTIEIEGLDASLAAADLVICQTGCLSHGDYWRVRDHCKRTGKSCVLVEQPEAVRIVRIHQLVGEAGRGI